MSDAGRRSDGGVHRRRLSSALASACAQLRSSVASPVESPGAICLLAGGLALPRQISESYLSIGLFRRFRRKVR